jgi:hypothetical protein
MTSSHRDRRALGLLAITIGFMGLFLFLPATTFIMRGKTPNAFFPYFTVSFFIFFLCLPVVGFGLRAGKSWAGKAGIALSSLAFLLFVLLMLTGYSPMPTPDFNYTDLHRAAERCDVQTAKESFKPEDLDKLDREGYTPLAYAARGGCLEVAEFLVEKGAHIDLSEEHSKWTPLHQAADQKHAEMVDYLLKKGADPEAVTSLGDTPMTLATRQSAFRFRPPGNESETVKVLQRQVSK